MNSPPTGTITFLFTDIEGSSRLWERHPVNMGPAVSRHDEILREAIESNDGYVFKTVGDAFYGAFHTPVEALRAALTAQRALFDEAWGETGPLRVRMGLNTGHAEFRDNDYFGGTLNRLARITAAGHGGQVLLSYSTAELLWDLLPDGVQLRDLGERRLRSLNRPEHLFQLCAPGLPEVFPPLRTVEAHPNNLPAQLTSFVGQEKTLETVRGKVGAHRLLTLTGPGGAGKTRLALEVASEALDRFEDGVWLVELALVTDPAQVLHAVALALDVRGEPDRPLRETVLHYLRGKNLLLILDNCEHLVAACADIGYRILQTCPNVRILATSRFSLGIRGEVTWSVPPLSMLDLWKHRAPEERTAEVVGAFDAAQLFVTRAQAVKPEFELTDANAADVARICYRLDGIPLALELAAARIRVLSPAQIVDRLSDRFRLLRGGSDRLPHQQTLRALIEWSYDLLSEEEKTLFRRLAVFAGGRTIEAVEAVCSGEEVEEFEVLDLLQQLADKSLITIEEEAGETPRCTMTESVWQYARDRFEATEEAAAVQDRHLDYYLELTRQAEPQLFGPELPRWLDRLDAERLNLRFALQYATRTPGAVQRGLRMVGNLQRAFEVRANLEEVAGVVRALLDHPEAEAATPDRASAEECLARIEWSRDRYDESRLHYEAAQKIFLEQGLEGPAARVECFLGFLDRCDDLHDSARSRFERALTLAERLGDQRVRAIALNGIASEEVAAGRLAEARETMEATLRLFRKFGDRWIIGFILWGLSAVAIRQCDEATARAALAEWAENIETLRNRWAWPYVIQGFADLELAIGNPEKAASLYGLAEREREAAGIRFSRIEELEYGESIDRLRDQLPPEELATLWEAGRHFKRKVAIEEARQGAASPLSLGAHA